MPLFSQPNNRITQNILLSYATRYFVRDYPTQDTIKQKIRE